MSTRILDRDLKIERIKRSGPGGQHRNKRDTGIRITHLPTGIVVMATEDRSQSLNLRHAMERLEEKIEKHFRKPKHRKKTSVPFGVRTSRLEEKRFRSKQKEVRKPIKSWD